MTISDYDVTVMYLRVLRKAVNLIFTEGFTSDLGWPVITCNYDDYKSELYYAQPHVGGIIDGGGPTKGGWTAWYFDKDGKLMEIRSYVGKKVYQETI